MNEVLRVAMAEKGETAESLAENVRRIDRPARARRLIGRCRRLHACPRSFGSGDLWTSLIDVTA
ncbi:hypothetical protein AB0I85_06750 [Micromonospora echinofusca]|uniref:hypothetical protein n=1 Tax=Micromonospora echinofusca TaxID=47858 RepID=UPI003330A8FE